MRYFLIALFALLSFGAQAETFRYEVVKNGQPVADATRTYVDEFGSFDGMMGRASVTMRIRPQSDGSWNITYFDPGLDMRVFAHIPKDKGPYFHNRIGEKWFSLFDEKSTHAGWTSIKYIGKNNLGRVYEERSSYVFETPRGTIENVMFCRDVVDDKNRFLSEACSTTNSGSNIPQLVTLTRVTKAKHK